MQGKGEKQSGNVEGRRTGKESEGGVQGKGGGGRREERKTDTQRKNAYLPMAMALCI